MNDQPQQAQQPVQAPAAGHPSPDARPVAVPGPPQAPVPPQMTAAERVRAAARRRDQTDYIFGYWSALGWAILTLGIYGYYVFYQLVRRMRDHNARRLELLDAATTVAWEQAEAGAGHELSVIYARLGQQLPSPDQGPVKRPDNYVGRILATIFTLGIYLFWWFYNQMDEPNKHFTSNCAQEDDLVAAVNAIS